MTMAAKIEKTAAETYQERAQDIGALMTWLQDELEVHETKAKADPKNWALVGDLGHVQAKLVEVLTFLSRNDEKAVAEALADLRN
jgi:hypothetical protein